MVGIYGATKIKDYDVNGITFEIYVMTSSGAFCAMVDGSRMDSPSLKGLQEKIKKHVKTSRNIAVPITTVDDYGPHDDKMEVVNLTLTGIHGGSGNVLAKNDKTGATQQLRFFYGKSLRRLTGPEIAELFELWKASKAAVQAVEDWLEERGVNPEELLRAAAEAADPAADQNTEKEA